MDVIIAGAGGHGRVILDILRAAGQHTVVAFLDANRDLHGTDVGGVPVVGHLTATGGWGSRLAVAAGVGLLVHAVLTLSLSARQPRKELHHVEAH